MCSGCRIEKHPVAKTIGDSLDIIAFTGPRGVGKTSTALKAKEILKEYNNIYVLSFANFLREWNEEIFGPYLVQASLNHKTKDSSYKFFSFKTRSALEDNKTLFFEVPTDLTPRDILIKTGTFLREINPDIFCIALQKEIEEIYKQDSSSIILIDDLRFDNELVWLKNLPYNTALVYVGRVDKTLESEKINDYQSKEKCDTIYEVFTESIKEIEELSTTVDRQWIIDSNRKELSNLLVDILGRK